MTQYNSLNVKLSNSKLNKIKLLLTAYQLILNCQKLNYLR